MLEVSESDLRAARHRHAERSALVLPTWGGRVGCVVRSREHGWCWCEETRLRSLPAGRCLPAWAGPPVSLGSCWGWCSPELRGHRLSLGHASFFLLGFGFIERHPFKVCDSNPSLRAQWLECHPAD